MNNIVKKIIISSVLMSFSTLSAGVLDNKGYKQ